MTHKGGGRFPGRQWPFEDNRQASDGAEGAGRTPGGQRRRLCGSDKAAGKAAAPTAAGPRAFVRLTRAHTRAPALSPQNPLPRSSPEPEVKPGIRLSREAVMIP